MNPETERYLARCFELAAIARSQNNNPVGALIVLGNEIIAEASELSPAEPFMHAELIAVQQAMRKLAPDELCRAVLYSSKEPCLMCSYAIRAAKLGRVVYNEPSPGSGGVSSPYPILRATNVPAWGNPPEIEQAGN